MKIFKYPLFYYTEPELIKLPKGAKILQAGIQEENDPKTVFWALVDPEAELEERTFILASTGGEIFGKVENSYNVLQFPNGIVTTFLELSGVKGNDPTEDPRLK